MNDTPQTPPTNPQPADPTAASQVQDDLNPAGVSSRRHKEVLPTAPATPAAPEGAIPAESDVTPVETASGTGSVEQEAPKELEPEVEKAAERIRQHKVTAPKNTVVASDEMPQTTPKTVAQPVVVLPLSEKDMQKAKRKNTQYSIRWLYQWCVRQIQKFADVLVIYRDK